MLIAESVQHLSFDLEDEEGRQYVTAIGQPGSNSWSIKVNDPGLEEGARPPMIIAHGNTENQVRRFMHALGEAFNRHAESK